MTPQVLDKLKSVAVRYDQLMALVSDATIQADPPTYRKHSKALAEIQPLVDKFAEYQAAEKQLADAKELAASGDADLEAMAADEIASLEPKLETLFGELQYLLIPKDPNDEKSVMVEIRAGTGGDEAALFAGDLYRMYQRFTERRGWKWEVISVSETGTGGMKEAIVSVDGSGAYGWLKHESGVHRVQRVPTTEAAGRIHTSTATVAVLPEAEEVDVQIDPKDIRIDTFCSSGPGGQSVNTTYSAVRITHIPTGIVVSQQDEKSQIKNRAKAMKVLRTRLYEAELQKQQDAIAKERRGQVGSGDRSEKIRTYNFKENRITDHRINFTIHQLTSVLEGDMTELIEQMRSHEQAERLRMATDTSAAQ